VCDQGYLAVESGIVWDDDEVIYGIESESYGVEWFAGWYLNPELHSQKAEGSRQ
jgi:hypothetical protein